MTTVMNELVGKTETTTEESTDKPELPIPVASNIALESNSSNERQLNNNLQEQLPQKNSIANDEKNLYVAETCNADKCYRVQWEAESTFYSNTLNE